MRHRVLNTAAIAVGAALAMLPAPRALAAPPGEPGAGEVGAGIPGFGAGDWLEMGVRLALVLGVIWGAFLLMRWYVRRMNGERGGGSARQLQIVETRSLGPNRALHLVRIGGRAVLIGATQERISQLLAIDDPEEVERLAHVPEGAAGRSVRDALAGVSSSLMRAAGASSGSRRPAAAASRSPITAAVGTHGSRESLRRLLDRLGGLPEARERPAPRAPAEGHADGAPDVTPPAARALLARGGYRASQIAEVQRAIEHARRGGDDARRSG